MAKLKTGRHTGAMKAHRQSQRAALRNRILRKKMRETTKEYMTAVGTKEKQGDAKKLLTSAYSALDKMAKKGTIHWKTASRRKSRLAAQLAKTAAA
ncbi:MAG: 30S ribosomal protein S20 [Elusimicrobia bacterium GWA2_69_24]|nr:MAG: 30S ribosomal protein S20 [Elusimicrobia bacterium GWA2_69_24]